MLKRVEVEVRRAVDSREALRQIRFVRGLAFGVGDRLPRRGISLLQHRGKSVRLAGLARLPLARERGHTRVKLFCSGWCQ